MASWQPLAPDDEGSEDTRFILDNDVDVEILHWLQGARVSVVQLQPKFRSLPDEDVLAEAKRQDRVLITHDQRFVDPHTVETEKNPGILIIPRDGRGNIDFGLVGVVLAYVVNARDVIDQTVLRLYPSRRFTLWSPDENTGEMVPVYCRVSDDDTVQVLVDDDGYWATDPTAP